MWLEKPIYFQQHPEYWSRTPMIGGEGRRWGKRQTWDIFPADCTRPEVHPQAPRSTRSSGTPSVSSANPTCPLTLQQFPVHASKCGCKSKLLETKKGLRKQAAVCGQGRSHKLELQCHLLDKKREVSVASQVTLKTREGRRLRILPLEGRGGVERVDKTPDNNHQTECPIWKQPAKISGSACYFKCKSSNAKLQGPWKIKETCHHQKKAIIFQKLKGKEFCGLADGEFKMAVSEKFSTLQENSER